MSLSPARIVVPLVLAMAVAMFGCGAPPEAEKKAAEQAVSAAKAAGAEKYASAEFSAAAEAMKAADSQMSARKFPEAKAGYLKAKELAEKAATAAEAGKATMKSQVEQQLADAERRWRELEGKAKAAARNFKAGQKQDWEVDARSVAESFQAARAAVSGDPASAKEKLDAVAAILQKWDADLKALAAPAKEIKKRAKK